MAMKVLVLEAVASRIERVVVTPETVVLVVATTAVTEATVEVADALVLVAAASEGAPVEVSAAVSAVFPASEVASTVLVDAKLLAVVLRVVLVDSSEVAWALTTPCWVVTAAAAVELTVETEARTAIAEALVLVAVDRTVDAEAIVVAFEVSNAEL